MKLTVETLLNTDLVYENEWLYKYVDFINANELTPKVPYETQCHHILPKFYYEMNDLEINSNEENLVNLFIKDHILAHYFLARCTTPKYKGLGFASINYILRHNNIKNLPELEEFVKLLDNIEIYYKEYRELIAESQRNHDTNLKRGNSVKAFWDSIRGTDYYSELCNNRSIKQKGRKMSEEQKHTISKVRIERGIAKGENNGFYGKKHSEETKNKIRLTNGNRCVAINSEGEIVLEFISIKDAGNYIRKEFKELENVNTIKRIKLAAANNQQFCGFNWLIINNGHKKREYTESGLAKVKSSVSKARGLTMAMCDKITGAEIQVFDSLNIVGKFIQEQGLDTLHIKNIGKKIKDAALNGGELYGYKWKIIKV